MKDLKSSVYLTVCVSCRESPVLLEENLTALNRQTLDKTWWDIVLLQRGESSPVLKKLLNSQGLTAKILTQAPNRPVHDLRNQALQKIKSSVLFFIDEDVILKNTRHLEILMGFHKQNPDWTVLGGGYLSSEECSFWGRAYNWVARLWMLKNPGLIPAGNLSVKTGPLKPSCRFKSPLKGGFGGEEVFFLNQVRDLGLRSVQKTELDALHLARHTLKDFLSRAILHGQSRAFQNPTDSSYKSAVSFIRQPESFFVKVAGLFYLILVRLTAVLCKVFFKGKDSSS